MYHGRYIGAERHKARRANAALRSVPHRPLRGLMSAQGCGEASEAQRLHFWNVVLEKRMTLEEMVRGEARRRFAPMVTHRIKRREALERFLGILGLTHSQEAAVLSHEQLVALGEPLQAAEKAIREGMGLRASQRKGEWKVGNTMDLIRVILEEWGGGTARSEVKVKRVNKKFEREYILYMNEKNVFWDSIKDYNTKMDDFLIRL